MLDVIFEAPLSDVPRGCTVRAHAVDATGDAVVRRADLAADVDTAGNLIALHGADAMPQAMRDTLIGASAGSGFRGRTAALTEGDAEQRLLRRLCWELPITLRISGQQKVLKSMLEAAGGDAAAGVKMSLFFVDQCSGWREGGEMLTRIAANDGALVMNLGPERPQPAPPQHWLADTGELPLLATRRSRLLSVDGDRVSLSHRDWYSDNEGIVRALHEWDVSARLDLESGTSAQDVRFADVEVTHGRLPWRECPSAGGSGAWLNGRSAAEIDELISEDFIGIATCTHLNDTLRMFADVTDLLALEDPAATH
jgi:hypothetical protein